MYPLPDSGATRRRPDTAFGAALAAALLLSSCGRPEAITPLPDIAGTGSAEPRLSATTDGRPVLSWLEPDGDDSVLRYSRLDDDTWSRPTAIASGDDWFVNWADFPSVVPITDSLWAAHWLRKRPGNSYSYDVVMTVSTDDGSTWIDPLTPHDDGTATEHGFVSLFPWMGGVGALWLDGRNMAAPAGDQDTHGSGGMTLRSAVITPAGDVTRSGIVDGLVCDCCQTDVAVAADGPVAVYRNRTEEEIRDIYVARAVGDGWSEGVAVADDGWHIAGCPVNGPAIVARGSDVAVAWFTAADQDARVRVAFSGDGGRSFGPAIDVDDARPAGRVGIVNLDDGNVLVSWLAPTGDGRADVRAVRLSADGGRGTPVTLASTAAGRMSGFPQILRADDDVIVAWTDVDGEKTVVKSAVAPVSLF